MIEQSLANSLVQPIQQAVAARKDYQQTGLPVTLDKPDAGLAAGATTNKLPMPEPNFLDQSDTALLALLGSGQGLYGANVGQTIVELRDEWL